MDHKDLIEQYDVLHKASEFEKAYELLLPLKDCKDAEVLWRLAQALHDRFYGHPVSKLSKKCLAEAMQYVDRALELDEECYGAHMVAAAVTDLHYQNISVRARVEKALVVRDHMKRAAELRPNEHQPSYMLGWWYFTVSDLPWAVKKLTQVVFSTELEATYDMSLKQFEAVLEKPGAKEYRNYSLTLVMIGKCNLKLNNRKTAIQYFREALLVPERSEVDTKAHNEAKQLLNSNS